MESQLEKVQKLDHRFTVHRWSRWWDTEGRLIIVVNLFDRDPDNRNKARQLELLNCDDGQTRDIKMDKFLRLVETGLLSEINVPVIFKYLFLSQPKSMRMATIQPSDRVTQALRNCNKIILYGSQSDYYKIGFWDDNYRNFIIELKTDLNGGAMRQATKREFEETIDALNLQVVNRKTAYQQLVACVNLDPGKYDRHAHTITYALEVLKPVS